MSPERGNDAGGIAILAGGGLTAYGAIELGRLLGDAPVEPARLALGVAALVSGPVAIRWGRNHWRAWRAAVSALEASIPEADRLEGDVEALLAEAFGGTLLAAEAGSTLAEALVGDADAETRAERFDRVSFVRGAIPQLAYHVTLSKRWTEDHAGPGVYSERRYWRVRADVDTAEELFVSAKGGVDAVLAVLGVRQAGLGDEPFDRVFAVTGRSLEWARRSLTAELRAILLRRPTFVLRCHRRRVELLWDASFGTQTLSRFEDASRLVTALARALSELPPAIFR